jgi:dephospho-CoA kinase
LLKNNDFVAVDGLYSWEEYVLLKQEFPFLILINIYAEPLMRYERLSSRPIRSVSKDKSRERDILELEKLNKGGPIAIADYCIINNGEFKAMYSGIDDILKRLKVSL